MKTPEKNGRLKIHQEMCSAVQSAVELSCAHLSSEVRTQIINSLIGIGNVAIRSGIRKGIESAKDAWKQEIIERIPETLQKLGVEASIHIHP